MPVSYTHLDVYKRQKLGIAGNRQNQLKLLEQHRKRLLEKVHTNEKRIDCLDYLVFQMNKEE